MNRSSQLYNLVKSLSRGEKRHFKLLTSKYSKDNKNIPTVLFDIIDNLNDWDEDFYHQKLEKFKIKKHISVHTNTLIEQVLNSLRVQEQGSNKKFIINKLIEESYILFDREELELALKRIQKAKLIAKEAELYIKLNEILNQERDIQFRLLTNENYNDFRKGYISEINNAVLMLKNQNDYLKLVEDIFYIYRSIGYPQQEIEKTQYAEILKDPLLASDSTALCSNSKSSFYFVYTLYYLGLNELQKASEIVQKQVAIYEKNPAFLESHVGTYISILNNLLVLQSQLDNIENFQDTLTKLRGVPEKFKLENSFIQWRIFETSYSAELDLYIIRNMMDELSVNVPIVVKSLNKIKQGFSFERYLNLALRVAVYYYRVNQLDEAHNWITKILNNETTKSMIHIVSYTMLLDLVVHFKFGNYNYLEYRIQTVTNFFKKRSSLLQVNKIFFKTLKKLIKAKDIAEVNPIIIDYKKAFDKCPDSITKRYYSKYLMIDDWIDAKFDIQKKFA